MAKLPTLVTALILAGACHTQAAQYVVDGSCAVDGDGTADRCATSAGGAGAFRDPQSAFAAARAGDEVLIKNGTYLTSNQGSDTSENGGFSVGSSGTQAAPIVFRNYPGHSPLLANCPASQKTYCPRPTITAPDRQWVTIESHPQGGTLRIQGGIWIYGDSPTVGEGSRGVVLRGLDIALGWGEIDDGNWSAIFFENQTGGLLAKNTIHDIAVPSGGGQQSSGGCIKLYHNTETVVEHNTCRGVDIPDSQGGGIDDKAQATRNVHRHNWIEGVNTCVRVNNQLQSTGVKVYGNVCIGRAGTERPGVRLITNINGIEIYNNTIRGFAQGLQIMDEGPVRDVRWYNNIVTEASAGLDVEAYQAAIAVANYNAWRPGARFNYGGSQGSFGAWRGLGFDDAGRQVNCQVQADARLAAGSPCRGAGRVGGLATGAAVDLGAFGVGACVGAACGTAPPPP